MADGVEKVSEDVHEISEVCSVARNTLNDMLTYDKIESGMILVEKAEFLVLPFLMSEFRTFSIQVQCNCHFTAVC